MAELTKVPLRATSWCVSCSSQSVSSGNLLRALYPIIQVINELDKWNWPYTDPWSTPADFSPARLHADHNPLSPPVQPDFSLSHCPFLQSVLYQFVHGEFMEDHVKSLAKVNINNICCSPVTQSLPLAGLFCPECLNPSRCCWQGGSRKSVFPQFKVCLKQYSHFCFD